MQKYDWLLSEYVLQEEFLRMSTIRYQFASVVQGWYFGFTERIRLATNHISACYLAKTQKLKSGYF